MLSVTRACKIHLLRNGSTIIEIPIFIVVPSQGWRDINVKLPVRLKYDLPFISSSMCPSAFIMSSIMASKLVTHKP